jgi:hypothetical protein
MTTSISQHRLQGHSVSLVYFRCYLKHVVNHERNVVGGIPNKTLKKRIVMVNEK